jgi:hypothetical protein
MNEIIVVMKEFKTYFLVALPIVLGYTVVSEFLKNLVKYKFDLRRERKLKYDEKETMVRRRSSVYAKVLDSNFRDNDSEYGLGLGYALKRIPTNRINK